MELCSALRNRRLARAGRPQNGGLDHGDAVRIARCELGDQLIFAADNGRVHECVEPRQPIGRAKDTGRKGSPVDFVFPREGVSAITQPVAVLKTAHNIEAAKAFVAWQLSEEAQRQSVTQGYFPIFADVAPPAGYPPVAALKIMPGDLKAMLDKDDENKRRFMELFGG